MILFSVTHWMVFIRKCFLRRSSFVHKLNLQLWNGNPVVLMSFFTRLRFCGDSSFRPQLFSAPYDPGCGVSSRTSSCGVSLPSLVSAVQPGHTSNAPLLWTGTSLYIFSRTNASSIWSNKQICFKISSLHTPLYKKQNSYFCLRCTLCSRVDHECSDREDIHRPLVPRVPSTLVRLKDRQPLSRGCMVRLLFFFHTSLCI